MIDGERTSGPQPADLRSDDHVPVGRRTGGPTTADQRSALPEELTVDEVLSRREMIVAVADGEITAAALLADWLVAGADAALDWSSPATLGALVWRIGSRALRLYALGGTIGVADMDSVEWEARSGPALDAAAALIRRRGGDALERAEFARLFATGEPQKGLTAWLESRSTRRQA